MILHFLILTAWTSSTTNPHARIHNLAYRSNEAMLSADLHMIVNKAKPGDVVNLPTGRSIKAAIFASFDLQLRGARGTDDHNPCLVSSGNTEAVIEVNAEADQHISVDYLALRHNGNESIDSAAVESAPQGEDTNSTLELSGTCCLGVDGGVLSVTHCSVVAINGTCIGATGNTSRLHVQYCVLHNSSVGIVGYEGSRIACESSSMQNLGEAGVVAVSNDTLAELDSNDIADCRAFGAAATGGARMVARGNRIARCGRAGLTVTGAGGWLHALGNDLTDNGDYGVSVDGGGTARIESNRFAGHQYGVTATDPGTLVWLCDNSFERSAARDVASAGGGLVEWDGGHLESRCVSHLPRPGPTDVLVPTTRLRPADDS